MKPLRLIAGCAVLITLALLVAAAQKPPAPAAAALGETDSNTTYIEGELKSKNGGLWVVGEFNVLVDEQTQVIEKQGPAEPGAWLLVWADGDGSGNQKANTIIVDRAAGASNPRVQFTDVLNKVAGEWWVVGEQLVHVGPNASIVGAPSVGSLVSVTAERQDLILEAILIATAVQDVAQVPLDLEGTIEAIEGGRWMVDGRWVELPPDGGQIEGAPAVGKQAEVRMLAQEDGTLVATQIRVPEKLEVSVGALVADIAADGAGAEVWNVSVWPGEAYAEPYSATVHVDIDTLMNESRAVARPGQWADVVAMPIDPDEFQAEVIRVERTVTVTLEGDLPQAALASGSGGWAQVGGRPVWFPAEMAGKVAAAGRQGKTLIEGILLGNGAVLAQRFVQVEGQTP